MNNKEFKIAFGNCAKKNNFSRIFGSWYIESVECITVLELQKSNFGDYYMLRIKTYIQNAFDRKYIPNKDLMMSAAGHINNSETTEYRSFLNFDEPMDDILRLKGLENLFNNHIVPFTFKTSTMSSILDLANKGDINLLSSVKDEILKLS